MYFRIGERRVSTASVAPLRYNRERVPDNSRRKLQFLYFDAGGGHRAAATALKAVIEQQQRPWDVELVNIQEVLEPLDIFRRYLRIRMEDVYNLLLRKGWTLGSGYMLKIMHGLIRLYHRGQVRVLAEYWRKNPPDLVVSLIPNFGRAVFQALQTSQPAVPLLTILTDMADYPPHFWMERQPQYYVCGTDRAVEQAVALGHSRERIFRTSGMILRPHFYEPLEVDRAAERVRLGLAAEVPTGILLFGGQGSRVMKSIVERLQACQQPLQLIALCGRNEALAAELRKIQGPVKVHVVGFTQDVPYYMHLADFLIGKPGPGSISEALAMHLPVIVESNAWTLPQERFNAQWVVQQGVGLCLPDFREITPAVESLLSSGRLAELRARTAAMDNRAVFEIQELLAGLLEKAPCGTSSSALS